MNLPTITIIILNWNGRQLLGDCLFAVMAQDYPRFQTILVDNNSSDDSVAFVKAHFPQVDVIENGANLGFAAGNNVALRQLQSEIAVLLNPDVTVSAGWLRNLVQPLLNDDRVGITGGKLHYPGGRTLQHAGGRLHFPQAIPTHDGIRELDEGQHDQERDAEYVIGAALALRSELLTQIGLLDEGFFLFYEDVDLCYRARQAGFRVVYVPSAVAIHVESATAGKGSPAYLSRFHISRWRFLLKHYRFEELVQDAIPAEQHWLGRISHLEHPAAIDAYQAARQALPQVVNLPGGRPFSASQVERLDQELRRLELIVGRFAAALLPATNPIDPLQALAVVHEGSFVSNLPVIGPLVAGFRKLWNGVSTQWYVRPLLRQQNQFNQVLVARLRALESRVISQDQDLSALILEQRALASKVQELMDDRHESGEADG